MRLDFQVAPHRLAVASVFEDSVFDQARADIHLARGGSAIVSVFELRVMNIGENRAPTDARHEFNLGCGVTIAKQGRDEPLPRRQRKHGVITSVLTPAMRSPWVTGGL